MTLLSVMAYHSFSGEVEASNTPTIRRLTPSCRHQLPRIAPRQTARPASCGLVTVSPLTLLRQVTQRIISPRQKRAATDIEPSDLSPQKIRMVGGVTDPFVVR